MSQSPESTPTPESGETPRKESGWLNKFRVAFSGLGLGIRGESSFAVHFFFSILVIAAAAVLRCELWQWCVLIVCVGFVLTAELFNSAIETLFRGLDEETKKRAWPALDIAAGAVLLASIAASVVGGIIFIERIVTVLP